MKSNASTLLRRNISAGQMAGYVVSNIIGLAIIMVAVLFYRDINSALNGGPDSVKDTSYMILSHPVGVFGGKGNPFTPAELDSLRAQDWVDDAATLSSASFNVDAYINAGGRGSLGTAFFLEAVPDRFLDHTPADFTFTPGDRDIPVILPRDYLSLYNYGFASSRGLPAISEEMAASIPLTLSLRGERGSDTYSAHIAGFTNRINSILVPEDFLAYANATYGTGNAPAERVIVKTDTPGNPAIEKYLSENSLQSGTDTGQSHRLTFFLEILTGTVITIGAVITLLSLFILLLSLSLLIQKSRNEIRGLLLLGYSISQVSATYTRMVLLANALSLVTAAILAQLASSLWRTPLAQLGIEPGNILTSALPAGLVIALLLTLRGTISIRAKVSRSF